LPDPQVMLNLSVPQFAVKAAALESDGVGLMRAEFIALGTGRHPGLMLDEGGGDAYVAFFREAIETVAGAFHPRPITYRALDLKANEYRQLEGGDRFERDDPTPVLGRRGAFRYLQEPEVFALELRALREAIAAGHDNVRLMIPYVRTATELGAVRGLVEEAGLIGMPGFELWAMAEVPAFALVPDPFLEHVDGVSIGSNDLRQLVLGVDRDSAELQDAYTGEDDALYTAMVRIVEAASHAGKKSSVCGDQVSRDPQLLAALVDAGISSVSVVPDALPATRAALADRRARA
jgi:phosphoenolpyruvate synthase/pyruvate phosphate dikinase